MLEPTTGGGTGSSGSAHDISVLNSLIETTIDSVDGYRRSAQEATSSRFSSQFLERANEREQVVSKLREAVRSLGGSPEDDGSVLAAAHRAFLSLKDKVTGSDDAAIIGEVDHGETYLAGKWEAALKDDQLSQQTRQIVQQCYDSVREGRDTFRRLHEDVSGPSGSGGGSAMFGGSGGSTTGTSSLGGGGSDFASSTTGSGTTGGTSNY
jgi:uncharacterized protein (TIGR02284 family)